MLLLLGMNLLHPGGLAVVDVEVSATDRWLWPAVCRLRTVSSRVGREARVAQAVPDLAQRRSPRRQLPTWRLFGSAS
jgi:hypothetical protein